MPKSWYAFPNRQTTVPNTCNSHYSRFVVYAVENPIIETQHLAMYSILSWIPGSNIGECLKHLNALDDCGADLARRLDALLVFAVMSDCLREVLEGVLGPIQLIYDSVW
jgi:hypothetical protein